MESIWTLYKSLSTYQCTHCWLSHVDELAVVFVGEAWGKHAGKIKCAWDLWKESMCVETQKYVYIWPSHSNTKSQWKVFQIDQLYFSRMALNIRLWGERLVIFFHLIIYICGFQPLTPGYTWHNCHNPLEISRLEKKNILITQANISEYNDSQPPPLHYLLSSPGPWSLAVTRCGTWCTRPRKEVG